MGHKETVKDTARVLGRMYDAIEYRGFGQETAEELARWAGVPICSRTSGIRPRSSPTSSPSACPGAGEVVFCYLGDARFNMADSYLIGGGEARHGRPHRQPEIPLAA